MDYNETCIMRQEKTKNAHCVLKILVDVNYDYISVRSIYARFTRDSSTMVRFKI